MLFSRKVLLPSFCIVALINLQNSFLRYLPDKESNQRELSSSAVADDEIEAKSSDISSLVATGPVESPRFDEGENRVSNTRKEFHLPNVLMIGAQATKFLEVVDKTIGACGPKSLGRETHFFDNDDEYSYGIAYYAHHFMHCKYDRFTLDATSTHLGSADRIHDAYNVAGGDQHSNLKVIVIMREPIAREYAAYMQHYKNYLNAKNRYGRSIDGTSWSGPVMVNKDGTIKSFNKYVETITIEGIHTRPNPIKNINTKPEPTNLGMYAHHLKKWFHHFDRKQILILSYDEVVSSTKDAILRVSKFLDHHQSYRQNRDGLLHDKIEEDDNDQPSMNEIQCSTLERLSKSYEPLNNELYALLNHYENERPDMEQKPLPAFHQPTNCSASS